MPYLLDTNVWIDCLKNPSGSNATKLQTVGKREIVTCSIIRGELMHGAQKYGNQERRINLIEKTLAPLVSYAYDDGDAEVYAALRNQLEKAGNIIGPYDLQIAAIAVRRHDSLRNDRSGDQRASGHIVRSLGWVKIRPAASRSKMGVSKRRCDCSIDQPFA